MNPLSIGLGMSLVVAGTASVATAAWRQRAGGNLAYLRALEADPAAAVEDLRLEEPFLRRVGGPLARGALSRLSRLCPPANLDRLHSQILRAGLSASLRAEELATIQVLSVGAGLVVALVLVLAFHPVARLGILGLVVLPLCGLLGPRGWIQRRGRLRTAAIQRDLPDVLDLLTISVEAGLGFEQAIEATCSQLRGALSDELAFTLREMSLGLGRREALDNLRRRNEVEDLSVFVVVLMQADALGMPIARVLRAQADEMRAKRRQRAREQAAKLPVKILFPLIGFVFPPMMIIVLGPAMRSIMKALAH